MDITALSQQGLSAPIDIPIPPAKVLQKSVMPRVDYGLKPNELPHEYMDRITLEGWQLGLHHSLPP